MVSMCCTFHGSRLTGQSGRLDDGRQNANGEGEFVPSIGIYNAHVRTPSRMNISLVQQRKLLLSFISTAKGGFGDT